MNRFLQMTLAVPATSSATTISANFSGFSRIQAAKFIASVQGLTGGTLDVYIQHSMDGGATWYDAAHFAQFAGGAAGAKLDMSMPPLDGTIRTVGTGTAGSAAPLLAANTAVSGPWGGFLRLVSVSGTGVSAGAFTISVDCMLWDGFEGLY